MTYASEQLYITFGGVVGSTVSAEVWQCGLHFAPIVEGGVVGPPNQDQSDAVLAAVTNWLDTQQSYISSKIALTFAKVAHLDESGDYLADPFLSEQAYGTVMGPNDSDVIPPQAAGVITFWSGGAFGKANYGRIYLPAWGPTLNDDFQADGTARSNTVTGVGVMISDVYDAIEDNKTAGGILDLTNMSFVGSGTNKRVTQLRCGSVVDTQRRRRNRLPETYTTISR